MRQSWVTSMSFKGIPHRCEFVISVIQGLKLWIHTHSKAARGPLMRMSATNATNSAMNSVRQAAP